MDHRSESHGFDTPVTRYYIDIRPYVPQGTNRGSGNSRSDEVLPLSQHLPQEVQDKIKRYHKASDRYMALASALLKHLFIHRAAKIPWTQVEVSRTPKPHLRPYWQPLPDWQVEGVGGIEFNVSHQAGVVVLVGCNVPKRATLGRSKINREIASIEINPDPTAIRELDSEIDEADYDEVRIGVDIACTNESSQTANAKSQSDVNEWVDIFGEMFSKREILNMKFGTVPRYVENEVTEKIRRFFTYWSLKEAYIKMVGEGLLADWLRELEFTNVTAPLKPKSATAGNWANRDDDTTNGLKITFKGKNITQTMRTELESFEDTFVVATMFRGVKEIPKEQNQYDSRWVLVDLETDIKPCAEGRCSCTTQQ